MKTTTFKTKLGACAVSAVLAGACLFTTAFAANNNNAYADEEQTAATVQSADLQSSNHTHTWKTVHHDAVTEIEDVYELRSCYFCLECGANDEDLGGEDKFFEHDNKHWELVDEGLEGVDPDDGSFMAEATTVTNCTIKTKTNTNIIAEAYDNTVCETCGVSLSSLIK